MSKVLGSQVASARFNPLQEAEAGHFLMRVLNDPDNLTEHIRTYVSLYKVTLYFANKRRVTGKPDPSFSNFRMDITRNRMGRILWCSWPARLWINLRKLVCQERGW
jgi:hypothetical protein